MAIVKQMEIRSNIKKYFDAAYDGEVILVPRKENKNVVIISENEYERLNQLTRLYAYETKLSKVIEHGRSSGSAIHSNGSSDVLNENLAKLKMIAGLKKNWNGNGASPFQPKLIAKVTGLLRDLQIQPEIFPTAIQTIQLEYDNSRHDHMEIEIGTDTIAEVFIVTYQGNEILEQISSDASVLNERILAFYG